MTIFAFYPFEIMSLERNGVESKVYTQTSFLLFLSNDHICILSHRKEWGLNPNNVYLPFKYKFWITEILFGHRPVIVKKAVIGSKERWKLSTLFKL